MFQLTRQEQLIVALVMLALIVGTFVRMYHYTHRDSQTLSHLSISNSPPYPSLPSHAENIH